MPVRTIKVVLGYKHEDQPREFVSYVEAHGEKEAFLKARRELRTHLVNEVLDATEKAWAQSYEPVA